MTALVEMIKSQSAVQREKKKKINDENPFRLQEVGIVVEKIKNKKLAAAPPPPCSSSATNF